MTSLIIKKYWEQILIILLTLPFFYFAYVYLITPSLSIYDAPGHLGIIWYLKNYLWPNFTGWNFTSLLGFDQGRFYPPLFHYLAATLSFIFDINLATKLVIIASLITLPLAIYYFVSSFFKDLRERVLVSGIIIFTLVLLPGYFGADLKALFQVGLLTSFVSTTLVFAYLGTLFRIKKLGFFWPTLLLAAIVLTHLVAGVFAAVVLVAAIVIDKVSGNQIRIYLLHAIFAALLTSFFWLPFLVQSSQISNSVHLSSLGVENIVSLVLALGIFLYPLKKKNLQIQTVALAVLVLSLATTLDYFVEKLGPSNFLFTKIYSFHLYRLQIYEFLLAALLFSYFPVTMLYSSLGKVKTRLYFFAFVPIIAACLVFVLRSPVLATKVQMSNLNADKINGRFLETFSRDRAYPFIYTEQNDLVMTKRVPWAYGLFTDANQNGPFLSSLIRSFSPDSYPKATTNLVEEKTVDQKRINNAIDLFGIDSLIFVNIFVNQRTDGLDLGTLKLANQNLVEIPELKIVPAAKDWNNRVADWWGARGEMTNLLINTSESDKAVVQSLPNPQKVEITTHSKGWDTFTVNSKENTNQPILIKFSFSPNWKAYQGGREIKIYQTSPNLMLVFAKGKIDFKYQTLWYQYLGDTVSLIALVALGWYGLAKLKRK